jgi:hypothetical protein
LASVRLLRFTFWLLVSPGDSVRQPHAAAREFRIRAHRLDYQGLAQNRASVPGLAQRLPSIRDVIHREKHLEENRGDTKMKTLKTIMLGVGAVALSGASGLYAQTKATADIPFEFSVQNTTLPAGEYTMSTTRDVMLIRNVETNKAILVLAPEGADKGAQDKNVVRFHRIGDRYFLAEVKTDGVRSQLAPSKLERELTAEGSGQTMAAVIVPALSVR